MNDIIGFMDGVSILVECMDKCIEQNAFYCSYDCNTMVNNVFAYGPDGKYFLLPLLSLEARRMAHCSCNFCML